MRRHLVVPDASGADSSGPAVRAGCDAAVLDRRSGGVVGLSPIGLDAQVLDVDVRDRQVGDLRAAIAGEGRFPLGARVPAGSRRFGGDLAGALPAIRRGRYLGGTRGASAEGNEKRGQPGYEERGRLARMRRDGPRLGVFASCPHGVGVSGCGWWAAARRQSRDLGPRRQAVRSGGAAEMRRCPPWTGRIVE
jgi:hypothetical protein